MALSGEAGIALGDSIYVIDRGIRRPDDSLEKKSVADAGMIAVFDCHRERARSQRRASRYET